MVNGLAGTMVKGQSEYMWIWVTANALLETKKKLGLCRAVYSGTMMPIQEPVTYKEKSQSQRV